ncbi:DNA-binding beta-propeller fold protein YncE [Nocardioides sp. BE266]|uniref:hypothetical protein n=1 Tax=Nocardioides sp. BE266 TaxID=2817725 RepID=UPI00285D48B2|nr:hypothetical protein [Nocardioides sp. BE266]MDR7253343.1 DNA-binding beta-propeller fold protein YncE [Nocardioides sp. BE266]
MIWVVGALLLAWIAWGPVVLVLAAAALLVPRLRWWVQDRLYIEPRIALRAAGAAVLLAGVVLVVPDGWLPIPQAPGVFAGPSYVGRPATPRAITSELPQNPQLPAVAPAARPGPLGLQPEVETSWFGLQRCSRLEVTSTDLLVALCGDRSGPSLRLVDADTMRPRATKDLPAADDRSSCEADPLYLDAQDRAVVATTDRSVLVVGTASGKKVGLHTETTWDLKPYVPYADCLVALAPDWAGRVWWASAKGLVGTIAPDTGDVRVLDLDEGVAHGFAADADGGVILATDQAVHRLSVSDDGSPQVVWTAATDHASGTTPVLVDGGAVAVTETVKGQLSVVFLQRGTGEEVCRQAVFEKDEGAADAALAPVGPGVVVTNDHDYSSPRSTLLGFTSSHGIARVDLVDGSCAEQWTSDQVAPGSGAVASWPNGLVYAWTKRPSLLGVSAWYVTGLDAATGRSMWSVRAGTGLLASSFGSELTVGPGGSVWMGTMAGLVRVTDRS